MNYEQKTKRELVEILHKKDSEIIELNNTINRAGEYDVSVQKELCACKEAINYHANINNVLEKTVLRMSISETVRIANEHVTPNKR